MRKIFVIAAIAYGFGLKVCAQDNNLATISTIESKVKAEQKLEAFMSLLQERYVEELDNEKVAEDAIKGILKELDPHSSYINKEKVDAANEPLRGNFEGVGIQFNILDDTIMVVSTISGGPSEKLGIMPGDKIVSIEKEVVAGIGITNRGVVDRLRGPKGTEVNVEIKRGKQKKFIDYTIERDKIPLFSMDAAYMVTDKIGLIKLNRFAAKTVEEFQTGLYDLKKQGMESLILDLRGNGGGYLRAAWGLADEFLPDGKMIVYTEGERAQRSDLKSTSRGGFEEGKLIVLIDEGSASASEIVSGAIQDWDRGLVIGRRSFGKGLVQREFELPDESAVRLTIAKYFTPTGRCIQKPYEEGVDAYRDDLNKRYENGEFFHMDSIDFPDSLKYTTPNGRLVYGGGGIMPDIFIPVDTSEASDYLAEVRRKGLLYQFAIKYTDSQRDKLNIQYKDVYAFKKLFNKEEALLKEFVAFAKEEGVEKDSEGLAASGRVITAQLKALVARNLWKTNAYFVMIRDIDETIDHAVKVLEDNTFETMKVAHQFD